MAKIDFSGLKGNEIALRPGVEVKTSVMKSLGGVYEEQAKLVFLLDTSGSMDHPMSRDYVDSFVWEPEVVANLRGRVAAACEAYNKRFVYLPVNAGFGFPEPPPMTDEDLKLMKLCDPKAGPNGEINFTADDEELKRRIIEKKMVGDLSILPNWAKHSETPPTRLQVVKRLAVRELKLRFEKFPKSQVSVIAFAGSVKTLFTGGSLELLWKAIEELAIGCDPWETQILSAIRAGMDDCRQQPSPVGVHHIILVSDGGDWKASETLERWVPNMKASGVVLDYIHIGDRDANDGIAAACRATDGELAVVSTERQLEDKFVEAVRRKLLPPPVK